LGLNWGGISYPWNSPAVIALLVVGGALIPVFICWEIMVARFPICPMSMFKYRNVRAATGNNFFTSVSTYGISLYLPTYYQLVRGDVQLISGVETLAYAGPLLMSSTAVGFLIARTGVVRIWLWMGGATNLLANGLLIMLNGTKPRAVEYIFLILAGMGFGFTMQTNTISAQSQVGRDLLASVTTMAMWSRSLGGIVGIAMQGSIIQNIFRKAISASPIAAPYLAQLADVDNVPSLPEAVKLIASQSYGTAFGTMMIATTAMCVPGVLFSLTAQKEKLD